jgi:hypothetical protein
MRRFRDWILGVSVCVFFFISGQHGHHSTANTAKIQILKGFKMSQTFKYTTKSSANRKIKTLAENQNYTLAQSECGAWIVTVTAPTTPEKTLFEKVAEKLPETCKLIYVDYNDNLDNIKEFKQAITLDKKESQGAIDALCEKVWDWYIDNQDAEKIELAHACDAAGVCFDALDDADVDNLTDILRDRDNSDPLSDLLKNTSKQKVRIHLVNNWEGFQRDDHSDYLALLLDFLRISPRDYAKKMGFDDLEYWPIVEYASAPIVDIAQFTEEVANLCSGLAEWVFYGVIDAREIMDLSKEGAFVTLPAGTACGLFDAACGGGSLLDCTTNEPLKIDDQNKFLLTHDDFCGYGIETVYGLTWDAWQSPINVEFKTERMAVILPFVGLYNSQYGEDLDLREKGGIELSYSDFFMEYPEDWTDAQKTESSDRYFTARKNAINAMAAQYASNFADEFNLKTVAYEKIELSKCAMAHGHDRIYANICPIEFNNKIYLPVKNHPKFADYMAYSYQSRDGFACFESNQKYSIEANWQAHARNLELHQIIEVLEFAAIYLFDYDSLENMDEQNRYFRPFDDAMISRLDEQGFFNWAINDPDYWTETGDFARD